MRITAGKLAVAAAGVLLGAFAVPSMLGATGNDAGDPVGAERPPAVRDDQPDWQSNALDNSGRVRGRITATTVRLPGGYTAAAVVDDDGSVVGYMVNGSLGFVDTAQARSGESLRELDACMTTYGETQQASSDCTTKLVAAGVNVTAGQDSAK